MNLSQIYILYSRPGVQPFKKNAQKMTIFGKKCWILKKKLKNFDIFGDFLVKIHNGGPL
jgi:hypothetical protein